MAATFAGTPTLSRRKSTWRYCFFGSSRAFTGSCLVIWLSSRTVINRRDAVYGLKLFSAIAASYLLTSAPAAQHNLETGHPERGEGSQRKISSALQVLRVLDH